VNMWEEDGWEGLAESFGAEAVGSGAQDPALAKWWAKALVLLSVTIPLVIVHLPFGFGLDWSVSAELSQLAIYFALAVIWDYVWFVMNPAYTVHRFRRGNVWWFQVPWIWRFPLDYYVGMGLSVALAGLAAVDAGNWAPVRSQLWLIAGLIVLTAIAVLASPLYHRWYRHMRRAGADDRELTPTFGPPAPHVS